MDISGHNLLAGGWAAGSGSGFHGVNPATGEALEPVFHAADEAGIARAVEAAAETFRVYGRTPPEVRAAFLRTIADEIDGLGDTLIERAHAETALPSARLINERGRTTKQLRLFADVLDEGSWVEARIDPGDPARSPPRPDVRRMLVPLGPVAVFGASNFPLAFSVPGGDTASALAAGNTVVCKAHPAHPGTSELAARAIVAAAKRTGLPGAVFSLLHGPSHEAGLALVRHPRITAVGFTGSLRGGRAVFDAAAARPVPIPVYAEMGSINPVFVLPSAAEQDGEGVARALAASILQGVGQFCTNPGVVVGLRSPPFQALGRYLAGHIETAEPGIMLHAGIARSYETSIGRARERGATSIAGARARGSAGRASPALLGVDIERFVADPLLREEMFGPVSVLVTADDAAGLERAAEALEGQLSASIFGTPDDLRTHSRLVAILERKVGRIVFNGVPTGVEVGHAMHHGGPYPATTDARTTSVGSAAITRFARPVCWQNFPDAALPPELRDANPRGTWRLIDGRWSRAAVERRGQ